MFKSLSQRSNKADRYPTNVPFRVESDKYEKEKKKRKKEGRKEGRRISCAARKVSPQTP